MRLDELDIPWKVSSPIIADELLPFEGRWQWHDQHFEVTHTPGQTWWHSSWMTEVDGHKVLFAGDSFQPASRWKGTGGYCSMNGARFTEGFEWKCAREWVPVCASK
jgi:glyoxylase-like metal-dependent hydrolase (beta-lactamase superfamily II)